MRQMVIIPVAAVLFAATVPAGAHKLNLFATAEGDAVTGEVYHTGGGAARGVDVTALGAGNEALGNTQTDSDGLFTISGVARRCVSLRADSPDGHTAVFSMDRDGGAVSAESPAAAEEPVDTDRLERKIDALRRQLDEHEHSVKLSDIIGGLGFIAGLTGVVFYLKTRRKRNRD